jgi:hypothetical protein
MLCCGTVIVAVDAGVETEKLCDSDADAGEGK